MPLRLEIKINSKAAESLADPEEYPNLFEDWQIALAIESRVAETRGNYPPAAEYVQHADRSVASLVESFRNMQMNEEPLENGTLDHEFQNRMEMRYKRKCQDEVQVEEHDDGHEEAVVVDVDSTDGAVLVNGNEAEEEEWDTNNEGKPSD